MPVLDSTQALVTSNANRVRSNRTERERTDSSPLARERFREIVRVLDSVAAGDEPHGVSIHDRRWQRIPLTGPILVQPLLDRGGELAVDGGPLVVEGRDLSWGGVSFLHTSPLPHRFAAVTFPFEAESERWIVAQLLWCRFTRTASYCSGGRFTRALPGPPCR